MESHNKAEAAIKTGRFKEEIIPFDLPGKRGQVSIFDQDEHTRSGLTMDDVEKLKPAFKPDGTVIPKRGKGAGTPMARIVA